jgi:hypothetical protein
VAGRPHRSAIWGHGIRRRCPRRSTHFDGRMRDLMSDQERWCETPGCGASLAGRRSHARFCTPCAESSRNAERCRRYRARRKARHQREHLHELVGEYLEQTRKRAVVRIDLDAARLAAELASFDPVDVGAILSTIAQSPERATGDDAVHHRLPFRDDLVQRSWTPPYGSSPEVSWCMRNWCAGVRWSGRPHWIAERGSLGFGPRRPRRNGPPPLSAISAGVGEQYREGEELAALHGEQMRGAAWDVR